jgi:hypothetical protein
VGALGLKANIPSGTLNLLIGIISRRASMSNRRRLKRLFVPTHLKV